MEWLHSNFKVQYNLIEEIHYHQEEDSWNTACIAQAENKTG